MMMNYGDNFDSWRKIVSTYVKSIRRNIMLEN